MTELLTAAQMRALEAAAIESGAVTGLELMERAGRGVVEAVFEEWPALAAGSYRAVVLCGPGNNGGDGFVLARLLKEWGWAVEVFLYGDAERLPPDARENYERWRALGEVAPLDAFLGREWGCDLLVDALFGTGLKRGLPALGDLFWNMEDMVDRLAVEPGHESGRPAIVAVDISSGICADSGREFPHEDTHCRFSAAAHLTVTFHGAKLGHYLAEGRGQCGKLVVKDIGMRGSPRPRVGVQPPPGGAAGGCPAVPGEVVTLVERPELFLSKQTHHHKFSHGHALILSGGPGRTGAARLAARGALRIGAGLVTLGVPGAAQMEVAGAVTAVMLRRAGTVEELARVLEDGRINAVCAGPGLGLERARGLVEVFLGQGAQDAHPTRAVVLDADALSAFEGEPEALFALLHEGCVMTPHGGEFARLFPDLAERLAAPATKGPAYSKVDAVREAAARAGCVVLYKGADTVIAGPDGRCSVHSAVYERAAPWLATAGSGDVLAGFITGLLARGFAPMQAAETAAWLHVECALSFGPGLIAEDLPEELPKVFRALGL
jgi:hydroxyethylthiazole kinase-like uncharacterized protein yjeF